MCASMTDGDHLSAFIWTSVGGREGGGGGGWILFRLPGSMRSPLQRSSSSRFLASWRREGEAVAVAKHVLAYRAVEV